METYECTIQEILDEFLIKRLIIAGCKSERLMEFLLEYSKFHSCELIYIDFQPSNFIYEFKKEFNFEVYTEHSLDKLKDFTDYDAIFIDGNPNWFTVFHELKIIERYSKKFPLVFICNSVFPNERRDCYYYFENIPSKFINDYTDHLLIQFDVNKPDKMCLNTNEFHAIYENSPKNGVLTAIEDFISESSLNVGKTIIDSETGIILIYFKSHEIFKSYHSLCLDNRFCNLKIKHNLLKKFLIDYFNNNCDELNSDLYEMLNLDSIKMDNFIIELNRQLITKNLISNDKDVLLENMRNLLNSKIDLLNYKNSLLESQTQIVEFYESNFDNVNESIMLLKYNNHRFFSILLSYMYIFFNVKHISELKINIKLFHLLNNCNWFDWGFYFKNNKDISKRLWFKILTPEAHYVCNGYSEGRLPNSYYLKKSDKKELFEYLKGELVGV